MPSGGAQYWFPAPRNCRRSHRRADCRKSRKGGSAGGGMTRGYEATACRLMSVASHPLKFPGIITVLHWLQLSRSSLVNQPSGPEPLVNVHVSGRASGLGEIGVAKPASKTETATAADANVARFMRSLLSRWHEMATEPRSRSKQIPRARAPSFGRGGGEKSRRNTPKRRRMLIGA